MQVEREPSPWPCVLMLAGLLLFCLAAPYYWSCEHAKQQTAEMFHNDGGLFVSGSDGVKAVAPFALPSSRYDFGNIHFGLMADAQTGESQVSWGSPTIDELVAAHTTYGRFGAAATTQYDQPLLWKPWAPPIGGVNCFPQTDGSDLASLVDSPEVVTTSLARVGEFVADYSPAAIAKRLVSRLTEVVTREVYALNAAPAPGWRSSTASQLQLVGPGDRLAMRPARPQAVSWCVPQSLYDQLQRLSQYPHSAPWASHVGNQLHAITDRPQLEGEDVQPILADLSDAAQEALQLADSTGDSRLRVELLRAHWALARRIDCWVALHEERMAYHFQGRTAARGQLSPYFDSAPAEPSTPANAAALSQDLERYELTRDPALGNHIAAQQRALAASPASFDRALADAVEQHYRNANVRIAITGELINRIVGARRSETRPVRDRIGGAFVRGQSDVFSQSRVELAPAENEWQLRIETTGTVESNTLANSGPVRFRSRGATEFSGSKSIVVRPDGVHMQPADIDATSQTRLIGVTTDYDWVPVVGGIARDRALQEYRARQNRVRTEMESKVSAQAGDTLDREAHDAMERARQNAYARFTERFDQYGIKLTTIEMKSTPERLVARLRVAGEDQLGSNTPRPRALADSLASLQVHETAITNLATTLGLDGQRLSGAELQAKLRKQFPKLATEEPQAIRRDTIFQFAPQNAVQVHIQDGRLEVAIAFDSVELDGEAMTNIIVHAKYQPSVDGLSAQLSRDGTLGIEGQISSGERARLHNIFQQVLAPDRVLTMVHFDGQDDHAFDGLMITQLVLEDGWAGIAVGPSATNRVAERSRSLR
ncbi:MAG: hypothetical protein U0805_14910 [Pirellulales bacterium]